MLRDPDVTRGDGLWMARQGYKRSSGCADYLSRVEAGAASATDGGAFNVAL